MENNKFPNDIQKGDETVGNIYDGLDHNASNDFVTIVQVNNTISLNQDYVTRVKISSEKNNINKSHEKCSSNINDSCMIEEVIIYRLPGERLGMGLKFIGGEQVSECINELFIQSITSGSPASRTRCQWGCLEEGDKILEIEKQAVTLMTRLDCVSILKDAPVALSMLVQHTSQSVGRNQIFENNENTDEISLDNLNNEEQNEMQILMAPLKRLENHVSITSDNEAPKPTVQIRPKKINEDCVNSIQEIKLIKTTEKISQIQENVDIFSKDMLNSFHLVDEMPVVADMYTDLIAEEEKKLYEYESDDTGSSVSTVIDSLSKTGNSVNYDFYKHSQFHENGCLDFVQALLPFEELEHELNKEFKPMTKNAYEMSNSEETKSEIQNGSSNQEKFKASLNKYSNNLLKTETENKFNDELLLTHLEGHVSQERKKFEILIEQATPKHMKNSKNYNKQSKFQSTAKKDQISLSSAPTESIIIRQQHLPPPIPPRQNKKMKNKPIIINENSSHLPQIKLINMSNEQFEQPTKEQFEQPTKKLNDENNSIPAVQNNLNKQDEFFSNNPFIVDNSERLLAVESWLEDSIKSFSFLEETNASTISRKTREESNLTLSTQHCNNDQLLGGETGSARASTPILDSGAVANFLDVSNSESNAMESSSVKNSLSTPEENIHEENENNSDKLTGNSEDSIAVVHKSENDFASRMPPDGHEFPPLFDESTNSLKDENERDDKRRLPSESVSNNENSQCNSTKQDTDNRVSSTDNTHNLLDHPPINVNLMVRADNNQATKVTSDEYENACEKSLMSSIYTTSGFENTIKHDIKASKLSLDTFKTINTHLDSKQPILPNVSDIEHNENSVRNMVKSSDTKQNEDKPLNKNNTRDDSDLTTNENFISEKFLDNINSPDSSITVHGQSRKSPEHDSENEMVLENTTFFMQSNVTKNSAMMKNIIITEKNKHDNIFKNTISESQQSWNKEFHTEVSINNNKSSISMEDKIQMENDEKSDDFKQVTDNVKEENHSELAHSSEVIKLSSSNKKGESNICSHLEKVKQQDSITSLYSLLESRKQQVSKLKGLIIPEKTETKTNIPEKTLPIPLIKSSRNSTLKENSKFALDKYSSLPRGIGLAHHCPRNDTKNRTSSNTHKYMDELDQQGSSNKYTEKCEDQVDNILKQNTRFENKLNKTKVFASSQPYNVNEHQLEINSSKHQKEIQVEETDDKLKKFFSRNQETIKPNKCNNESILSNNNINKKNTSGIYSTTNCFNQFRNTSQTFRNDNLNGHTVSSHKSIDELPKKNLKFEYQYINEHCLKPYQYENSMDAIKETYSFRNIKTNKDPKIYSRHCIHNEGPSINLTISGKNKWEELQKKYQHHSENKMMCAEPLPISSEEEPKDIVLNPQFKPKLLSRQVTVLNNNHVSGDSVQSFKALAEQWEQRSQDTKHTERSASFNRHLNAISSLSTMSYKDKPLISNDKLREHQRNKRFSAVGATEKTPNWNTNKRHSIEIAEKIPLHLDKLELERISDFNFIHIPQKPVPRSKNMPTNIRESKTMEYLNHPFEIHKNTQVSNTKRSEMKSHFNDSLLKSKYFQSELTTNETSCANSSNEYSSFRTDEHFSGLPSSKICNSYNDVQ